MKLILLFDLLSITFRWYFAMKTNPMVCRGLNTSPLHGTLRTILLAEQFVSKSIVSQTTHLEQSSQVTL